MYLVRNPQQSRSAILLKSTPLAALNCNYEPYIILELNFPAIYDTLPHGNVSAVASRPANLMPPEYNFYPQLLSNQQNSQP
jgi:hypothetical protein